MQEERTLGIIKMCRCKKFQMQWKFLSHRDQWRNMKHVLLLRQIKKSKRISQRVIARAQYSMKEYELIYLLSATQTKETNKYVWHKFIDSATGLSKTYSIMPRSAHQTSTITTPKRKSAVDKVGILHQENAGQKSWNWWPHLTFKYTARFTKHHNSPIKFGFSYQERMTRAIFITLQILIQQIHHKLSKDKLQLCSNWI